MKPVLTLMTLTLVIGLEVAVWLTNPLHIPSTFVPARAFCLQLFREPGPAMEPTLPADRRRQEPYLNAAQWRTRRDLRRQQVPAGSYFVMGTAT